MEIVLNSDDIIKRWNITNGVVSKNIQQVTNGWGVSFSNKFIVVQVVDDSVDLVPVKNIIVIVDLDVIKVKVATSWVGGLISKDGFNINRG